MHVNRKSVNDKATAWQNKKPNKKCNRTHICTTLLLRLHFAANTNNNKNK